MKLTRRKSYFIVTLDEQDIREFNAREHTNHPPRPAQFTFSRMSGECIRVLPDRLRQDDISWLRMRDAARNFAKGQEYHGYRT